jgi:nicotinamide-nucleotide amidase
MALGALQQASAHYAVATSGIAGPDGGSEDKPVGTVWIAWASRLSDSVKCDTHCFIFEGDRQMIRRQSVIFALRGLIQRV